MSKITPSIISLLHGPDQPGLVARVSGWIFKRGGNIIHADQHHDQEAGIFFQRVEWTHFSTNLKEEAEAFRAMGKELGMEVKTALSTDRPKIAIMVSKFGHCFHDILLRWKTGELHCEVIGVISNHEALAKEAKTYGIPFYYTPVSKKTKSKVEKEQITILQENGVELLILARYMQILSTDFINQVACPVINIHHSFLPAFVGARPHHQAYARGVKLIGATAHYATPVLDDGPIIHQAVDTVSHRNNVDDLIRKGRDLEKIVLAQAVRWQLENRILVYNKKTVIFD